jgi:5'-3' exonuclease
MMLVIDGNNLANMCSYGANKAKNKILSPSGDDVTTANIFMKRLYSLYDKLYPDNIVICWDKKLSKGSTNFRKEDCEYKANRKGDNESLYKQCDIIEKLTNFLGIRNIHPNVMEADDIMAWIAHNADDMVVLATFDKDLLQLVNNNVSYFNLRTNEIVTVNNFEKIINIRRSRFLLYKMILGDRYDNIQVLKGYGKIKSKRLAESNEPYKTLSQDQLKLLKKNKKLMDLKVGYIEYPDEVLVYKSQFDNIPEKDFDKFYSYASLNNIQYIRDYKWKWNDLCLNT